MSKIPLAEGRRAFGDDPISYAAARPDYPDELYGRLAERCHLRPATAVFEIGAGAGLATARLLTLGAAPLLAIEPNPNLAAFLRRNLSTPALRIDERPFEEVELPPESYDLGTAATSFHWLDQSPALAKVRRLLKPKGWWAMWWMNFGGATHDAFQDATDHLFADTPDSPSQGERGGPPFSLDREARLRDLELAGFDDAEAEFWHWTLPYQTGRLVSLYQTFSPVRALEPSQRDQFLCELARIADERFGGCVDRPFTAALYTAQRN